MRVGFIGLGLMGYPMAKQILDAGYELVVQNRSKQKVEQFVALGATAAETPKQVAERTDILFTCLLMPAHVENAYLGPDGALAGSHAGQIFCDTSTVDPVATKRIGDTVSESGVHYFDAPISGGPVGAEAGTLSVMCGGPEAAFETLRPVLETFGNPEKIFHLGPTGAGSTAKICNQMIVGVTHALVAEVMVLGKKAGMNPEELYKVLSNSSGQSNSLNRMVPNMVLPRDFSPRFVMPGIIKDLECGIGTGKALGVRTMLAVVAQQMYTEACGLGHAEKDIAAVMLPMEAIAGVEVKAG